MYDRDIFLAEDIRRDGRMGYTSGICARCPSTSPHCRCRDCEGGELLCDTCLVTTHRTLSLHMVEAWNGLSFERLNLKSLGLRVQLGHNVGDTCPKPVSAHDDDFVVIHINGIHEIGLDFCGCTGAAEKFIQILRYGWFPATTHRPRTAATNTALKQFHLLSFESKCSVQEYYQTLTRLTSNTGVETIRDRYRAFLNMVREYRHIKMLKRAGRGHDSSGIAGTKTGECAVLCPACPQPGLNLPDGWEKTSANKRWIYRLFLAIDANFRLKRRALSSEEADPSLGKGWAYFVDQEPYMAHVEQFEDLPQAKSSCSSHSAVNKSRSTDGLSVTGVGSVGCARHDCMRPHSIGDLQKGERYINMDYLFLSSFFHGYPIDLVVSYDIACQWCLNLLERIQKYAKDLQIPEDTFKKFMFLVPKFHLPAHIGRCQTRYSFNFVTKVGRTDGEAPERGWSQINPIALSTSEMGPGSRRDTLDDHFGDWNWKKTTSMGLSLLKRMKTAVQESAEQAFRFHQFDLGLREKMGPAVKTWEKEIELWENDRNCPNPFESRIKRPTQEAVRRELAEEDRQAQENGSAYTLHSAFSARELIATGLELEEQQRRLTLDSPAVGVKATDDQKAKALVRGNGLQRRIQQWIDIQQLYIPSTVTLRQDATLAANKITELWQVPLFLPSGLPVKSACDERLQDIEWRLRTAQAHAALDELRRALRLRSYLYIDKDRFARGQHQNTRSLNLIQRTQVKVNAAAEKYRCSREAISSLSRSYDETGWEKEFPELQKGDIQGLRVDHDKPLKKKQKKDEEESEGHRKVSWIWGALGDGEGVYDDEGLKDDLRIEWCKSRARAKRWQEEVMLLEEEMRRVLMFLDSQCKMWSSRSHFTGNSSNCIQEEGYHAYASRQVSTHTRLRESFEEMWRPVDDLIKNQGNPEASQKSQT
ncbi:hypothetical protein BDN72DRAFT_873011 [Pluteus cervinus]|uniref:Uncharacterized protein n=1 Tax=Pluteus cervinus TaxID=181527 RepID=A0ACD3A1M0_9AGAR|nr:hypothetical protein BDN72DRAFT_873011 [Pluteus cervinus]